MTDRTRTRKAKIETKDRREQRELKRRERVEIIVDRKSLDTLTEDGELVGLLECEEYNERDHAQWMADHFDALLIDRLRDGGLR